MRGLLGALLEQGGMAVDFVVDLWDQGEMAKD